MVTGFDYLSHDKVLQEHWLRRLVAIILDAMIVIVPISVFLKIIGLWYVPSGFVGCLTLFIYATLLESTVGGTIGKIIMHMKAVSISGQLKPSQALLRNLTKVFPPVLLLDWVLGMAMDTNDPRQKWTDRMARTSVIVYDHPGGT